LFISIKKVLAPNNTFPEVEFTKDGIVNDSIDQNSMKSSFEGGIDVESQGSNIKISRFKNRPGTGLGRPPSRLPNRFEVDGRPAKKTEKRPEN